MLDQHRDVVVVVFRLDEFCLLEARPTEFAAVYTSTAATVYQWERFLDFKRL